MESEKLKIVFDIETSGFPLETFSESQQEYLMRYVEKEKDEELRSEKELEVIRYLNLYPFTAKVIVIGLMNITTGNRYIIFESEEPKEWDVEEKKISYHGMTEEEMLIKFWYFGLSIWISYLCWNGFFDQGKYYPWR